MKRSGMFTGVTATFTTSTWSSLKRFDEENNSFGIKNREVVALFLPFNLQVCFGPSTFKCVLVLYCCILFQFPELQGPVLPGKTMLKHMGKDFLEKRRRALDHYLRVRLQYVFWLTVLSKNPFQKAVCTIVLGSKVKVRFNVLQLSNPGTSFTVCMIIYYTVITA
jgi:hypothetical protein